LPPLATESAPSTTPELLPQRPGSTAGDGTTRTSRPRLRLHQRRAGLPDSRFRDSEGEGREEEWCGVVVGLRERSICQHSLSIMNFNQSALTEEIKQETGEIHHSHVCQRNGATLQSHPTVRASRRAGHRNPAHALYPHGRASRHDWRVRVHGTRRPLSFAGAANCCLT
jgi:hypothetical protein